MDLPSFSRDGTLNLTGEWTAERLYRTMLLPYGAAGRGADELRTCPHCDRTYYRSNGGACPRCGGQVAEEAHRVVILPFGVG